MNRKQLTILLVLLVVLGAAGLISTTRATPTGAAAAVPREKAAGESSGQ